MFPEKNIFVKLFIINRHNYFSVCWNVIRIEYLTFRITFNARSTILITLCSLCSNCAIANKIKYISHDNVLSPEG